MNWKQVTLVGLFIAGGAACLAFGQIPLAAVLIGAAAGNSVPSSFLAGGQKKPEGHQAINL